MSRLLILLLLIVSLAGRAQNISGQWKGNFPENSFSSNTTLLIVTLTDDGKGKISGTSKLLYNGGYYEFYRIMGHYNKATQELVIEEFLTLGVNLPSNVINRLGNYTLKLSVTNNVEKFVGVWRDNNEKDIRALPPATVYFLRYKPKEEKSKPPPKVKTQTRVVKAAPRVVTPKPAPKSSSHEGIKTPNKRSNEIQGNIKISDAEKDSIMVELFDNGEIDGDKVSIYLDNTKIISNYSLTEKPNVFYLSLSEAKPLRKIKMVAESMGSAPPCTAYLRITTSKKQMGISMSSEWAKNGVLQFELKK